LARYPSRAFSWPGGSITYAGATELIGRMHKVFMQLGLKPGAQMSRVPDAVQRLFALLAEPGPIDGLADGSRISGAPRRKCGVLRSIQDTRRVHPSN
jgi:hypothetical protein